mgnify:CR=1 FL=1
MKKDTSLTQKHNSTKTALLSSMNDNSIIPGILIRFLLFVLT